MRRNGIQTIALILGLWLGAVSPASPPLPPATGPATTRSVATFRNPILEGGADPWLFYHDGAYYLTCTHGRGIDVWKSASLGDLSHAPRRRIWRAPTDGPASQHIWAPEIHHIDGRWYVYFAADDGNDANHRIYVLQSAGGDPLGPYVFKGKVSDPSDQWAIDPTVFEKPDATLYMIWSGWPAPPGPQNLYIAQMSNPWTIRGRRVEISSPTLDWEMRGWRVNEGPEVLCRNGKIFLIYSASGATGPDYCLGMLSNSDGDVLNGHSWVKSPQPVFHRYLGSDGNVFGPGHCGLFRSPDGTEDWISYHGRENNDTTWIGRSIRAQKFTWTREGLPDFGRPIPAGVSLPVPSGERENQPKGAR